MQNSGALKSVCAVEYEGTVRPAGIEGAAGGVVSRSWQRSERGIVQLAAAVEVVIGGVLVLMTE